MQTQFGEKLLILDKKQFCWRGGELWVVQFQKKAEDKVLCSGKYMVFQVEGEDELTPVMHLELSVRDGAIQGFLMPSGLPEMEGCKRKIVPTLEKVKRAFNRESGVRAFPV